MKIKKTSFNYFTMASLMAFVSITSAYFDMLGAAILFSILSYVLIYNLCKISLGRLNNITCFFLLFFALYTYSPILTVYFDSDIRGLFESATNESSYEYLVLCTMALLGFSIPFVFSVPNNTFDKKKLLPKKKRFSQYAIISLILATFGEFLNMFRAGGLALLSQGKAVYQAKVSDLFITIPSTFLLQISLFFLGLRLYLTYEKKILFLIKSKIVFLTGILIVPVLLLYISIGFRSPLLAIALAFLMGFTYFIDIKKINTRLFLLIFIGYSSLAILFGIRGQLKLLFLTKDWNAFNEYVIENKAYLQYYNPANNEFGASYMNYIKFYKSKEENSLLYGSSYFEGLIISIPSFLLPFEKPTPIDFKFRDMYFSSYKQASRISGTGFSSIMEAQWNFGRLGPFFVYFVLGCIFWYLEHKRSRYYLLFTFPVFYVMLLPIAQSFHRSSSGFYISYIILVSIFLMAIIFAKSSLKFFLKKDTNKL